MAKKPVKKSRLSYALIFSGVLAFVLRYAPLYREKSGAWFSLYSVSKLCSSAFSSAPNCRWVAPLNTASIIIPVALMAGGALLFLRKSKI